MFKTEMQDERAPDDDRFYWRNLRSLGIGAHLWLWPWIFSVEKQEDLYGGIRSINLGPIGILIVYSIGDCSAEHWWERLGGLSEAEAYDRAARRGR